jgi:hypothetical protein
MDNSNTVKRFSSCEDVVITEYKNYFIVLLSSALVLSVLGINVLDVVTNAVRQVSEVLTPIATNVLDMFGSSLGYAIKNSSQDAATGAKAGIDVAGGAIGDAGDLLVKTTQKDKQKKEGFSGYTTLDDMLNKRKNNNEHDEAPCCSSNRIQNTCSKKRQLINQ